MYRFLLIPCLLLTTSNFALGDVITLSPTVEGEIIDFPPLTYIESSFHLTGISVSGQEVRSIAEFNLSSLAAVAIDSATLRFTEIEDPGIGTQMQIHGYSADGVGNASDFFNTTNPIGMPGFNDGDVSVEELDVTTQIQSLLANGETFGGFLWQRLPGSGASFSYQWQNAQLRVDVASIPEPSQIALLGLALSALPRRRRNSSQ